MCLLLSKSEYIPLNNHPVHLLIVKQFSITRTPMMLTCLFYPEILHYIIPRSTLLTTRLDLISISFDLGWIEFLTRLMSWFWPQKFKSYKERIYYRARANISPCSLHITWAWSLGLQLWSAQYQVGPCWHMIHWPKSGSSFPLKARHVRYMQLGREEGRTVKQRYTEFIEL